MKAAITFVLFLCAPFLHAQTDPLPIPTNATWQTAWQSLLDGAHGTYAYGINGTTSINDTVYYRVEQFSYCGDNIPTTLVMLIREDSGKWYYRLNEVEPDELLFDFTLEVGESVTLETCFNLLPQPLTLTVVDIEDITMYDGSIRRMWTLIYDETSDFAGNTEYWIEGIGNMYIGLIHSLSFTCLDLTEWLHCYFENDDRKFPAYEFPAGIDCCNTVGISEQSTTMSISLYPNPTTDELTIQSPRSISFVEISDFVGRIIYSSKANSSLVTVNTELFSSGSYLLTVIDEQGTIQTSKFVKE
jgi:hypothetical protein